MGKNSEAKSCTKCGELIYYGGENPCCDKYDLDLLRMEATMHIEQVWEHLVNSTAPSTVDSVEEIPNIVGLGDSRLLHEAIWFASVGILPALEVQAVIDSNNKIHVSTGTAGFVSFNGIDPTGMKLPIRCWIHTHPFGQAYFSGTDWRTVDIWKPLMETAYVLGSNTKQGHFGFWTQDTPHELTIWNNGEIQSRQIHWREEE